MTVSGYDVAHSSSVSKHATAIHNIEIILALRTNRSISLEVEVGCGCSCAVGMQLNARHDWDVAGKSHLKFLDHSKAANGIYILHLFSFSKQHHRLIRKS